MLIRGNTIKYSSEKKTKQLKEEKIEDIQRLENEICINVNNQTVVNLLQKQNQLVNGCKIESIQVNI